MMEKIRFFIYYNISAALAGLYISFVAEQAVCVLDGNDAHAYFLGKHSLGGQLMPRRIGARFNILSEMLVYLHICRHGRLPVNN